MEARAQIFVTYLDNRGAGKSRKKEKGERYGGGEKKRGGTIAMKCTFTPYGGKKF